MVQAEIQENAVHVEAHEESDVVKVQGPRPELQITIKDEEGGGGENRAEDRQEEEKTDEEDGNIDSEHDRKSTENKNSAQVDRIEAPWDNEARRHFAQLLVVQVITASDHPTYGPFFFCVPSPARSLL